MLSREERHHLLKIKQWLILQRNTRRDIIADAKFASLYFKVLKMMGKEDPTIAIEQNVEWLIEIIEREYVAPKDV